MVFAHTRVALICTAPISDLTSVKEKIQDYPFLIAVDGGANHCFEMGLIPNLILGDFDSIEPHVLEAFSNVSKQHYPSNKDKTDLELAIEYVYHSQTEKIIAFGALGGRTDHILGNLILLSRYPGKVFLEGENETLFVIPGKVELSLPVGKTLSLIPLNGPTKGIDTAGLKWPLKNGTLNKQFIGISNETTTPKVTISVREGDLLCFLN